MLPGYIRKAMKILEKAGYEVWLVGGCVRDRLRGQIPHDYDLTTNAPPQEMLRLFEGYTCLLAGLSHGTVTPIIEHHPVEITTYRIETGYSDHRRPDAVVFACDIQEDLARRDFTINAMAWHPKRGLCDPFDGEADLQDGIIRAVGEPKRRFEEDALRILRGLRFAVRFGFVIQPQTAAAMREAADTLGFVVSERITEELRGILGDAGCAGVWQSFFSVFAAVLPGLRPMDEAPLGASLDFLLRLVLLCVGSGVDVTQHLRLTRIEQKALARLIKAIDEPIPQTKIEVRRFVIAHGLEDADALLRLWQAQGRDTRIADVLLCECVERGDCMSLADLAINGRDLDAPPSQIGALLRQALDAVASEQVPNEKQELLAYIKKEDVL